MAGNISTSIFFTSVTLAACRYCLFFIYEKKLEDTVNECSARLACEQAPSEGGKDSASEA